MLYPSLSRAVVNVPLFLSIPFNFFNYSIRTVVGGVCTALPLYEHMKQLWFQNIAHSSFCGHFFCDSRNHSLNTHTHTHPNTFTAIELNQIGRQFRAYHTIYTHKRVLQAKLLHTYYNEIQTYKHETMEAPRIIAFFD